ncbi:MAG: hypothetical protein LBV38_06820 [Alistipes sp.]|jgi:hypothetical protein|nr:hypothetical protein [Alistipes sp.]
MSSKTHRSFLRAAVVAMAALLTVSCIHDPVERTPDPIPDPEEPTDAVSISVDVPNVDLPRTRGIAEGSEQDNAVHEMLLLLFDPYDHKYVKSLHTTSIENTSTPSRKTVLFEKMPKGKFRAVFVANLFYCESSRKNSDNENTTPESVKEEMLPQVEEWMAGKTFEQVMESTELCISYFAGAYYDFGKAQNAFIMAGHYDIPEVRVGLPSLKLTRSVAKINVIGDAVKDVFDIDQIILVNANTRGSIFPQILDEGEVPSIFNPDHINAPTSDEAKTEYQYTGNERINQPSASTNPNSSVDEIFLPETAAPAGIDESRLETNDNWKDAVALLIQGSINGNTSNKKWFRVNLRMVDTKGTADESDDELRHANIVRNHKYVINIVGINGEGYDSREEAYDNLPGDLEYQIFAVDERDMNDIVFDGTNYMAVNQTRFEFEPWGGTQELKVFTDHPDGWRIVAINWDLANVPDWQDNFSGSPYQSGQTVVLPITAPVNTNPKPITVTVVISAGDLEQTITFEQKAHGYIFAPPGVIGIAASELLKPLAERKLTLRGSSTYNMPYQNQEDVVKIAHNPDRLDISIDARGLEEEPVYIVYFKWGSRIAVLGNTNDQPWDPARVVWVNPEFTGSYAAYSDITPADIDVNNTLGLHHDIKANPAMGHGDPCFDFEGNWRIPAGFRKDGGAAPAWMGNYGSPTPPPPFGIVYNGSTNPYFHNGIQTGLSDSDDYSYGGIFDDAKEIFLPAAGELDKDSGNKMNPGGGRYWSSTEYDTTIAFLDFDNDNLSTKERGIEATTGLPVRCVTGPPAVLTRGEARFEYTGGTLPLGVTSTAPNGKDVEWEVIAVDIPDAPDGVLDGDFDDEMPDWLTIDPFFGKATARPQPIHPSSKLADPDDMLRAATPLSGRTDLSTIYNGRVNTANSYIVNAAGKYSLPLVYGNAIKNGTDNRAAYTSTATGGTVLTTFQSATGPITSPYIAGAMDAVVVWQDASGLVQDVALSPIGTDLHFDIPHGNIVQGNAIVAVRDKDGTILWSWHIWVTPLVSNRADGQRFDATVNQSGLTHDMMQYNLGWEGGGVRELKYGPERAVNLRIAQKGVQNGLTSELFIHQVYYGGLHTLNDNNTYYQWGRKDPMPGGLGVGITNGEREPLRKLYYGDDAYTWGLAGHTTFASAINKPWTFNSNQGGNFSTYDNLWSANDKATDANNYEVVKTVYDPSPVGFKMPPTNTWTGFAMGATDDPSTPDTGTDFTNNGGYNFYLDPNDPSAGTAFYPASGHRLADNNGDLNVAGDHGYYWPATTYRNGFRFMNFLNGQIEPVDHLEANNRILGYAVRPTRDEMGAAAMADYVLAPPGVVGIRHSDLMDVLSGRVDVFADRNNPAKRFDLTLKGSNTYAKTRVPADYRYIEDIAKPFGGLEDEPVYVVTFKWGSMVAIIQRANDTWSADDVVWINPEFTGTLPSLYSDIVAVTPDDNVAGDKDFGPMDDKKGQGDICEYLTAGLPEGKWRIPRGIPWRGNGGSEPNFTNALKDSNNPVDTGYGSNDRAARSVDNSIFLPAAGDRNQGDVRNMDIDGRYWSSSSSTTAAAEVLTFEISGTTLSVSTKGINAPVDNATPIRCVQPAIDPEVPIYTDYVMAPPGVLGIRQSDLVALKNGDKHLGDGSYNLTLKGSITYGNDPVSAGKPFVAQSEFGSLEGEVVYVVYFKYGSTVAVLGRTKEGGQDWNADGSDVAWVETGFSKPGTWTYDSFEPATAAGVRNESYGLGDPCALVDGGKWITPTGRPFTTTTAYSGTTTPFGNTTNSPTDYWNDPSVFASWVENITSTGRSNGKGAITDNGDMFLPAVGIRDDEGKLYNEGQYGYYRTSTYGGTDSGPILFFDKDRLSPSTTNEYKASIPVRCVRKPLTKGIPAPPGVIGYTAGGRMTLHGSSAFKIDATIAARANDMFDDYGLEDEEVSVAYFKFGSLVATSSSSGIGSAFTSADIIAKPNGVNPTTWAEINDVSDATPALTMSDGLNIMTALDDDYVSQGLGDPCAYYGGEGWRLPTKQENVNFATGKKGSTTSPSFPANPNWLVDGSNNKYLPSTSFRRSDDSAGAITTSYLANGYYWSSEVGYNSMGWYSAYILSFAGTGNANGSTVQGRNFGMSGANPVDHAYAARCVYDPPLPKGVPASPGVIGYYGDGPLKGQLTLQGSVDYKGTDVERDSKFGPLADVPVYVAYFKFGSLVATSSELGDASFTADDIVATPTGYAKPTSWATINDAADVTTNRIMSGEDFHNVFGTTHENIGLGDACAYYFGNKTFGGKTGWRIPTGRPWHEFGDVNFGTISKSYTANWNSNGAHWVDKSKSPYTDLPYNGAVASDGTSEDWSMFLPAAGGRSNSAVAFDQGIVADYWASTVGGGRPNYSGNLLSLESSDLNVHAALGYDFAIAIRCVQPTTPTAAVPASEGGANDLLYYADYKYGSDQMRVGRWNGAEGTIDVDRIEDLAFFKFGSIVGLTDRNSSGIWNVNTGRKFNPTNPEISLSIYRYIPQYTNADWTAGWTGNLSTSKLNISEDYYHNWTNFKLGKGDPCRLAGLNYDEIENMTQAQFERYESGWRMATGEENALFLGKVKGPYDDDYWWTDDRNSINWNIANGNDENGVQGVWLPSMSSVPRYFMPLAGARSTVTDTNGMDGAYTSGATGENGYWSSIAASGTTGNLMQIRRGTDVNVNSIWQAHMALPIRCVSTRP